MQVEMQVIFYVMQVQVQVQQVQKNTSTVPISPTARAQRRRFVRTNNEAAARVCEVFCSAKTASSFSGGRGRRRNHGTGQRGPVCLGWYVPWMVPRHVCCEVSRGPPPPPELVAAAA